MSVSEDIKDVISILKCTDIDGCITGSSMIDGDYDNWETIPDIDVFVYHANELIYAVDTMIKEYQWYPATKGEEWKIKKMRNRDVKSNLALQTIKLKHKDHDVQVNLTWKEKRDNLFAVLSSFDMSIIMVGHDIQKKVTVDFRTKGDMVLYDENNIWSDSIYKAVPNPLREQKVDMYGAETWVRQYGRCIKYWDRGYDTREMAKFYIKLIDQVIEDGILFENERGKERYNLFVEEFTPMREQMVKWLKGKEDL